MARTHEIGPSRRTLHGHFSADLQPVVTIDPGDTVRFRTLDAWWQLEPRRSTIHEEGPPTFEPRLPGVDDGHALCGPVAIRAARAGMTLGVHIERLKVGSWGATAAGGRPSPLNDRFGVAGRGTYLLWTLDRDRMLGRDQHGLTVALRPFMGVMGLPPPEPGVHSTVPPRFCGGNLDCKELVEGSVLYLPVSVEGALFSTGDGHAAQGDGEVSSTAIECPMEEAALRFSLHEELKLTMPRAETPAGSLTFGFDEDLDEAAHQAMEGMLRVLDERFHLGRREALALASVAVDLRVTQICNGVRGVHALLPKGAVAAS
jgi:acetamidase/formamidase